MKAFIDESEKLFTMFGSEPLFGKPTISIDQNKNNEIEFVDEMLMNDSNIKHEEAEYENIQPDGLAELNSNATEVPIDDAEIFISDLTYEFLQSEFTKEEQLKNVETMDLVPRENAKESLTCDQCGREFAHYSSLTRHKRATHSGKRPFSCDICHRKFSIKQYLVQHELTHRAEKPFACDCCERTFVQRRFLRRHKQKFHVDKVELFEKDSLQPELIHEDVIFGDELAIAEKSPSIQEDLILPSMQSKDGGQTYDCDQCEKKFTTRASVARHKRRTHAGERPYSCEECGRTFAARENLVEHKRIHTGEKPYTCKICDKKFCRRTQVRKHMQRHIDTLFDCDECTRKFSKIAHLNQHKELHSSRNLFVCDQCGGAYLNKMGHKLMHAGEQQYVCECGKKFVHKNNLKEHKKIHTGKRRKFACDLCKKIFFRNSNLIDHKRRHHPGEDRNNASIQASSREAQTLTSPEIPGNHCEKPNNETETILVSEEEAEEEFVLDSNYEFIQPDIADEVSNLNTEMRGSQNEKTDAESGNSFASNQCNQNFTQEDNLKINQQTHNDGNSFACDRCRQQFENYSKLMYHKLYKNCAQNLDDELSKGPETVVYLEDDLPIDDNYEYHDSTIPNESSIDETILCFDTEEQEEEFTIDSNYEFIQSDMAEDESRLDEYCENLAEPLASIQQEAKTKSFTCECGREFTTRSSLWRHEKAAHRAERPYVCTVCGRRFAEKYCLTKHNRVHTDERPYVCDLCSRTFRWSSSLREHKEAAHKELFPGFNA